MKDSLKIDGGLPLNFWAEAMDTSNYLRHRLPTRRTNNITVIPEEAWTSTKQDLRIFGSRASNFIPNEKRFKSDVRKR